MTRTILLCAAVVPLTALVLAGLAAAGVVDLAGRAWSRAEAVIVSALGAP